MTDKSNQSMRFLFAWELGQHLGHVSRIAVVSRALIEKGHHVTLVLKNTSGLSAIKTFDGISSEHYKIITAPCYPDQMVRPHKASTIPEIIYYRGYTSEVELDRYVKQWLNIFETEMPDSIIFDYAPTALISALIFNQSKEPVPLYLFGAGYGEISSTITGLNGTACYAASTKPSHSQEIEKKIVDVINLLFDKYSVNRIKYYSEIYSVTHTFLTNYPEFDYYSRVGTPHTYVGPVVDFEKGLFLDYLTKNKTYPIIFAYLKPKDNRIYKWMNAFKMTGYKVILYSPGLKDVDRISFENEKFIIISEPASFESVLSKCDLVIHNGGIGTLISTIKAGLPSLLVPTQREQHENSKRLEKEGAGLYVYKDDNVHTISIKLKRLISDTRFNDAAKKISNKNSDINLLNAVDYISDYLIRQ